MLRILSILFVSLAIGFSCAKPTPKDEIPVVEYKNFDAYKKSNGADTAFLTLTYIDGDGDLFVTDVKTEGPTVNFTAYYYIPSTGKFQVYRNPLEPRDTTLIYPSIKQPADGYYKGKPIKGDITIPIGQFRPNDQTKILYFRGYLMDTDGNQSNIVVTPTFTLPI